MQRIRILYSEQGQSMVELALALPMLILLVLGVIDLGLGFRSYIALTNAAREGVRWVSIYPDDPAGALARTNAEAERIGLFYGVFEGENGYTVNFAPNKSVYAAGDEVAVAIDYDYELLFGVIPDLPSVPFQARATMVVLYDPVSP